MLAVRDNLLDNDQRNLQQLLADTQQIDTTVGHSDILRGGLLSAGIELYPISDGYPSLVKRETA